MIRGGVLVLSRQTTKAYNALINRYTMPIAAVFQAAINAFLATGHYEMAIVDGPDCVNGVQDGK